MEGMRCLVECWADFGDLLSASVICHGPDVILTTGTEHIFVFSVQERRVKASRFSCVCVIVSVLVQVTASVRQNVLLQAILQFDSPVTSLALNADQCSLYALCENNLLYCTPLSLESR